MVQVGDGSEFAITTIADNLETIAFSKTFGSVYPLAESVLPKSASFTEYAKTLFSLDESRQDEIILALETSRHSFSTRFLKKKFELDQDKAKRIRVVLLTFVYRLRSDNPDLAKAKGELVEMGFEPSRMDNFIKRISSISSETVAACKDLTEIQGHSYEFNHLLGLTGDVTFPYISEENHRMFPLIRIHLSAHGHRVTHEMELNLDSNTFEELLDDLEKLHMRLKTDMASTKAIAKDKLVDTVAEGN